MNDDKITVVEPYAIWFQNDTMCEVIDIEDDGSVIYKILGHDFKYKININSWLEHFSPLNDEVE